MAKSWLLDGRTIARAVKTTGLPSQHQNKDCVANWECPQCGCRSDDNDVSNEWPGFPIGVKFDPSDVELLEHLTAKCGIGNEKPHQYIDEFIPSLDGDEGICYEHPENLPGSRKDGNSVHFFYRTTNAYTTGQRKRRKIHNGYNLTRWHKTGKTKVIFKNGVHVGFKKIMVLYGAVVGRFKPCKLNWVMHQYHLGTDEEEKDGEYVVSKIFYQPNKQTENTGIEHSNASISLTTPMTPNINDPHPPRPGKSHTYQDVTVDYIHRSPSQESKCFEEKYPPPFSTHEVKDDVKGTDCEDETFGLDVFDNSLLSQNNPKAYLTSNYHPLSGYNLSTNDVVGATRDMSLDNLDLGSPFDYNLSELYFPSDDSVCDRLNWL